jgi:hypothetical protein
MGPRAVSSASTSTGAGGRTAQLARPTNTAHQTRATAHLGRPHRPDQRTLSAREARTWVNEQGWQLHLNGAATSIDNDVALAFGSTAGGSAVGKRFVAVRRCREHAGRRRGPRRHRLPRRCAPQAPDARPGRCVLDPRRRAGKVAEQSPSPGSFALAGSAVLLLVR